MSSPSFFYGAYGGIFLSLGIAIEQPQVFHLVDPFVAKSRMPSSLSRFLLAQAAF